MLRNVFANLVNDRMASQTYTVFQRAPFNFSFEQLFHILRIQLLLFDFKIIG